MTNSDSNLTLSSEHANIVISGASQGKRAIHVEPMNGDFIPVRNWTTSYPLELIEHVLKVKGAAYLCDEIMRDEDPSYVQHHFEWDILSYVDKETFRATRILDFGAGCGSSTMVLARMFPHAEIVSVDLVSEFIELARHRAEHYGFSDRVKVLPSPGPSRLPHELGTFDFVILSAVYEHLLPCEREVLLPLLWQHLKPKGIVFINQTPYRWFPIEVHTTGLPLINYLPDSIALLICRRFSKRVAKNESWNDLLRRGIRGATMNEIGRILEGNDCTGELLLPTKKGMKDHIDLWFGLSSTTRQPAIKKVMKLMFKALHTMSGVVMVPYLSLAIRKIG